MKVMALYCSWNTEVDVNYLYVHIYVYFYKVGAEMA